MKQVLSIIVSLSIFLFSTNVYAAPSEVSLGAAGQTMGKISPLKKGQEAPFDGVLLDASAAAKLMVDQQESENQCKIETEKEVATVKAKLDLDLANARASNEALQKELDVRVSLKDEHIEFLEKQTLKNAKKADNSKWWLLGGIAAGIALTIGGAFVIREVRGNQPIIINSGAQ